MLFAGRILLIIIMVYTIELVLLIMFFLVKPLSNFKEHSYSAVVVPYLTKTNMYQTFVKVKKPFLTNVFSIKIKVLFV